MMNSQISHYTISPRVFPVPRRFMMIVFLGWLMNSICLIPMQAQVGICDVSMGILTTSGGNAIMSSYPTNAYGQVETMWAKRVGNTIYPLTSWSISTSLTYTPLEAGNYRMCARRVGCNYIIESPDVYVLPCTNPSLSQLFQIDGGSYQSGNSIEVCEGQDVILDFEGSGYESWTFVYDLPYGASMTQTGYAHADQLLIQGAVAGESGDYQVTYTNPDGCSNTATFHLCVNAKPIATVSLNDPTCTNDNGSITFSFANHSGRSRIEFSLDGGLTYPYNVRDHIGSTTINGLSAGTYDLYVRWGDNDCPVSLQEVILAQPGTCASIGDIVFDDNNLNGIFDDGEVGVEGIVVELFEVGNNTAIDKDITNGKGAYLFDNVEPNRTYFLSFSNLPANYQFTTQSAGNDDSKDSDVDPATSNTFTVSPANGENLTDIDAGIVNSLNFPVEWLSFEVTKLSSQALIEWSTATELNAASYQVERSVNGSLFESLGSVKAAGTTIETQHYEFEDNHVVNLGEASIAYRIKQIDIDGTFSYSKVLELDFNEQHAFELAIYPNPASTQLSVDWTPSAGTKVLQIRNALGQMVFKQEIRDQGMSQVRSIQVENWTPGTYFVQISSEQHTETRKLLIK